MTAPRSKSRHHCLAVCTPGLEALLAREVHDLGIKGERTIAGGVLFTATTRQLYAANVWLRTATRILVRIGRFAATSFASLEQQAAEIDWTQWLAAGVDPSFRVSATKSKLYHTDAIAERLERVSGGVHGSDEQQEFVVRLNHDDVTISVNSSGSPLYQRGWRGPQGKAPLRETLAAALLLAAGWDGSVPLIDPMCGSGTIAIEAAMIARNVPPGWRRRFAFGDWPSFEPGTWSSVATEASQAPLPSAAVPIIASDRDEGAADAAATNAERAGVDADVEVIHRSLSDVVAPTGTPPGWLITNPPYGKRASGSNDLRNLFARLGQLVTAELPDWRVGLLVADPRTANHSGLPLTERLKTTNGGIDVRFITTP